MKPTDWNVVVAGAWNPAILTPHFVLTSLFQEDEGTPIAVEVALDRSVPTRMRHDGIFVVHEPGRLTVAPERPAFQGLWKAAGIAQRAIEELPRTPLVAAGVNVRFKFDEMPPGLTEMRHCKLIDVLVDGDYNIESGALRCTVKLVPGVINIELTENPDGSGLLALNHHLGSANRDELLGWLGMSEKIEAEAKRLTESVFGFTLEPGEEA